MFFVQATFSLPTNIVAKGNAELFDFQDLQSPYGQLNLLAVQNHGFHMYYLLSTTLLLNQLRSISSVKQIWLADDATGAGKIRPLKAWWDIVLAEGKKYGYYVNESKSWIIIKNHVDLEEVKSLFADSSIHYTKEGKRHLGASIGSLDFRNEYATEKVKIWCDEMKKLA